MRIVSLSYAAVNECVDPEAWISRLGFYTGVLEKLSQSAEVFSFHCIGCDTRLTKNNVGYNFARLSPLEVMFPFRLHKRIRELKPDVIIVHGLIFPWPVILLRNQLGEKVRIIAQHHKEVPRSFPRSLLQRVADRSIDAYLFTCCQLAEPWLKVKLISHSDKVREVFEGSSVFSPIDRNTARARTKVNGGTTYLWVGRLNPIKDPMTIVRSFIYFLEGGHKASLYMIFHTRELFENIVSLLALHPEVSKSVHLVGQIDNRELVYWYNSADFFILGSREEATSIAVCEAMSCGCIPILTDIPSFRAMTGSGKCGLLFATGDSASLGQALESSARMNVDSGRARTLEQFHHKLSFDAIARSIYEVVTSPPPSRRFSTF
jgi:glycosyltransferase involved in cell wall biosynthesis